MIDVWIQEVLRSFFKLLDTVVYWAVSLFANLFDDLSGIQIFSDEVLKDFSNRLYVFIAIIMIFKVSFSILQYIINPDNFTNSEKGVGKLVQSILMCLVAIVAVPHIFNVAYGLEKQIVDNAIFENIIFGGSDLKEAHTDKDSIKETKNRMSFYLLRAFIVPNLQAPNVSYDKKMGYMIGNKPIYNQTTSGNSGVGEKVNTDWSSTLLSNDEIVYVRQGNDAGAKMNVGEIYKNSLKYFDTEGLLLITSAKSTNQDIFAMNYRFGFSTVTGVLALILYINFCFDLAKRVVKFSFLQLIAPIPIISMVDPKSSKSGLMSKWIKNCLSTYAGLFIRIVAVNFAVYTVSIVFESSNNGVFNAGMGETGLFIQVMIVFGALMFAKELPKLITDLTGIDMKGDFKINPFKRVEDNMLLGKNLTGMAAGFASRGIPGLVGGFFGGQGLTKTWQAQNQRKATNQAHRRAMHVARQNGSTWGGRMGERFHNYTGIGRNATQRIEDEEYNLSLQESALAESEAKMAEQEATARAEIESRNKVSDVVSKMEDRAKDRIINGQAGNLSAEYLARQNKADQLKAQSDMYAQQVSEAKKSVAYWTQARANNPSSQNIAKKLADANAVLERAENMSTQISNEYANQVMSNSAYLENAMYSYIDNSDDKVISNLKSDYNSLTDTYGFDKKTSASDRHGQSGEFKGLNSEATRNFNENDKIRAKNNEEKRKIAEQKRQLSERKKASQANTNAVNRSNGR